jgi:hypothetical protein
VPSASSASLPSSSTLAPFDYSTYYYDQYEGSNEFKEDDVDFEYDENADFEYNDDVRNSYEYEDVSPDYVEGSRCPGSLEQCINVCVPLKDIYVYSVCVVECGDRCNRN